MNDIEVKLGSAYRICRDLHHMMSLRSKECFPVALRFELSCVKYHLVLTRYFSSVSKTLAELCRVVNSTSKY